MSVFKCKMCGGTLEFEQGSSVGVCDSCGTKQTLPKTNDDAIANLFNRANNLRLKCEFDKAAGIYEKIVEQNDSDAEAHWCIVLCKYGIEYVDDPATGNKIPTCHRTLYEAVTADADYQAAIDYSDALQQSIYESEAHTIDRIQKNILSLAKNEKPFDVFICYKETDENGRRTQDSAIANDIYYQLTQEGFNVFYAAITLEDKLGREYEPYIFAALNSAKVMLVVGTNPLYFNSVWMRNEWSRYLKLMKNDRKKLLIPCYRDMDAYELPEEFAHLQAQDMGKIGFINDIVRGIKKVISEPEVKEVVKETVVVNHANANTSPLLERAFIFLEDGKWQDADIYCEKVLDIDPKNAEAYLGKLMVELKVKNRKQLADCAEPFDDRDNYSKVLRFGDEKQEAEMRGYIEHINQRNENARLSGIYNNALNTMNNANSEETYKYAADIFKSIYGFNDAGKLYTQCLEKAEICRNDAIYSDAYSTIDEKHTWQGKNTDIKSLEESITKFQSIPGWKDADEQILVCQKKIEEIKAKEEADRIRIAQESEEKRVASAKKSKIWKSIFAITLSFVCIGIAFAIVMTTTIIPNNKYNAALELYNSGKYDEAISAFEELDGYKDSDEQIEKCKAAIIKDNYDTAISYFDKKEFSKALEIFKDLGDYLSSKNYIYRMALSEYESGAYSEAMEIFKYLGQYSDSEYQAQICYNAIQDNEYGTNYRHAVELVEKCEYEEAIKIFKVLNGYKDSDKQIEKCTEIVRDQKYYDDYKKALDLVQNEKYEEAIKIFELLDGYKDSDKQIENCTKFIQEICETKYQNGLELLKSEKYTESISIFTEIPNYRDSIAQISLCKYQLAVELYESSKYEKAIEIFTEIRGYKDSEDYIEYYNSKAKLKQAKAGDTILFGTYEQDNNTSNGKEDIEWVVLEKKSGKILVISKYILEHKQFDDSIIDDVTWEKSDIREWLNGYFLNNSFSICESQDILTTKVSAEKHPLYSTNPGNSTKDKVFFLSISEAKKYFSTDAELICDETDYSHAKAAYYHNEWWLRNPYEYDSERAYVCRIGSILGNTCLSTIGVRPAMWINLE